MASRIPLINLPELRYPTNALLDVSGLSNALTERRKATEFDRRQELDERRLTADIESQRLQNERAQAQLGIERERVGIERGGLGLRQQQERRAQEEAERQERERQTVRLGNEAYSIRNTWDPTRRADLARRFFGRTPGLADTLTQHGVDPNDHDRALDFLLAQVQDARERYAPQLVTGQPGSQVGEVTRGPDGVTVRPVMTVPVRPPAFSPRDIGNLADEGTALSSFNRLNSTFKDAYTVAGSPAAGDMYNWAGRNLPESWTAPETREMAQWWQDYQRNAEMVERHENFGASLTAAEQAAWRAATITPGMNAESIRRNLATREGILRSSATRNFNALVAQGYSPEVIARAYGFDPRATATGPAEAQPQAAPAGGWTEIEPGVRIRERR
jgi:hypothetical protein